MRICRPRTAANFVRRCGHHGRVECVRFYLRDGRLGTPQPGDVRLGVARRGGKSTPTNILGGPGWIDALAFSPTASRWWSMPYGALETHDAVTGSTATLPVHSVWNTHRGVRRPSAATCVRTLIATVRDDPRRRPRFRRAR